MHISIFSVLTNVRRDYRCVADAQGKTDLRHAANTLIARHFRKQKFEGFSRTQAAYVLIVLAFQDAAPEYIPGGSGETL